MLRYQNPMNVLCDLSAFSSKKCVQGLKPHVMSLLDTSGSLYMMSGSLWVNFWYVCSCQHMYSFNLVFEGHCRASRFPFKSVRVEGFHLEW